MKVLLAFDIGTTSVKCCAYDETFHRLAEHSEEYNLRFPRAHWVEMCPEDYWHAVVVGTRAIVESGIRPNSVVSITFTTQGETLIPVNVYGEPLTDAVVWLDDRAREEAAFLMERLPRFEFYHTTGLAELNAATPLAKLCWFAHNNPEVHKNVAKYLLLEDYLIFKTTRRFCTNQSLLSSTGYFDIVNRSYWKKALEAAGISEELLPPIIDSGTILGGLTAQAAEEMGLLPGTCVVSGAMDQICASIGAGNIIEGVITENTGTCLAVTATVEKPVFDKDYSVQLYTHYDGRYLLMAYNPTAAVVLKWFKDEFYGEYKDKLSPEENIYDALTAIAARIPPLSGGVTMIPHMSGRLFPDADGDMRGAFVGLSLSTTRGHMVRAILEGVAYMLRQGVECINALGVSAHEIRSVGGASVSKLWNEIKADVTQIPVFPMAESESTALGAAMLGAVGVGLYANLSEICTKCVKPLQKVEPDPIKIDDYDWGYGRFVEINRRLSNLWVENKQ